MMNQECWVYVYIWIVGVGVRLVDPKWLQFLGCFMCVPATNHVRSSSCRHFLEQFPPNLTWLKQRHAYPKRSTEKHEKQRSQHPFVGHLIFCWFLRSSLFQMQPMTAVVFSVSPDRSVNLVKFKRSWSIHRCRCKPLGHGWRPCQKLSRANAVRGPEPQQVGTLCKVL